MWEGLRELERNALNAQHSEKWDEAIVLWNRLVTSNSEWERGYPYYYLADCYTRVGELSLQLRHLAFEVCGIALRRL